MNQPELLGSLVGSASCSLRYSEFDSVKDDNMLMNMVLNWLRRKSQALQGCNLSWNIYKLE